MFKQLKNHKIWNSCLGAQVRNYENFATTSFNQIANPGKPSLDVGEKVSTRSSIFPWSSEHTSYDALLWKCWQGNFDWSRYFSSNN